MRRVLILVCFVFACTVFESSAQIKVLLLSGRNNHDWNTTTPYLKKMYESSGLFEVKITDNPETLTSADFKGIDVVVSNWSSFPDKVYRWPVETEKALIDYIKGGGGFVTLHAATTAFYEWSEFKQVSTGAWVEGTSHGKKCEAKVTIESSKHPITKSMANFSIFDELWMKAELNPDFKVLATAVNENTKKQGLDNQPVISVLEFGKGRVLHNALGHEVRNMRNIGFEVLMLRGTEWAATGKVKQQLPQELKLKAKFTAKYSWAETDSTFALLNGKDLVWQYNFREKHQKPHFNPIFIGRNNITSLAPDDHPWHAGQWFSWKYINGVNYWEYVNKKEFRSEGTTDVRKIKFNRNKDFSAEIVLEIVYHPAKGEDVLAETRTIKVSAPRADGTVSMDYEFAFKALADEVELNRTPIEGEENGKVWGGYGGLSLRFNQSFMDSYFIAVSENEELHASNVKWLFMGFTGLDGKKVGSQIIIHPNSMRKEAAWYVTDENDLPFYYYGPAYLFHKALVLSKDEKLVLNYRINHISGETNKTTLEQYFQEYLNEQNQ